MGRIIKFCDYQKKKCCSSKELVNLMNGMCNTLQSMLKAREESDKSIHRASIFVAVCGFVFLVVIVAMVVVAASHSV